ncbi:DoxX family protein [Flavobacterium sp.]|uniref:DoxX family protein n=1 Tax=Flavobacterium sp. TaxID=239 RepID=UPI00121B10A8|nr:DoxX family protein [Flavobacterium sp.]RZJ71733.1 MAG: DoxX family protein [Flavobacterium sp.]
MKLKNNLAQGIALLYIVLFIYAAISKLLDYSAFHRQLAMSPVLTSHADWLAWVVPSIEIFLALLLAFPKTRLVGMFGSLNLMVAFTVYIYLIMNYASHVPCSCGGILEKMGWLEHFYFNLVFVIFALIAVALDYLARKEFFHDKKIFGIAVLTFGMLISSGITVKLFLISERIVHYENRFQRRYPHPSVTQISKAKLPHNSYYIAGFDSELIYLGNVTAPLHLLSCDYNLSNFSSREIKLDKSKISFSSAQVRVRKGKFYLINGTVPYVFEGSVNDWIAYRSVANRKRFTLAELFGDNLAVRTFSKQGNNLLGLQPLSISQDSRYNEKLLLRQADGTFDTDGQLLTNENEFVYLYYYRNQFVVSDHNLQPLRQGKTIDTISRARVKVGTNRKGLRQMREAPLLVNRRASLYKNLLFVNSMLPGKEEVDKLWKQASIIDVYDIRDGSYRFSFPLYDIDGNSLDSFKVIDDKIYLINEKWIVRYDLKRNLLGDYQDTPGPVQGSDRKPVKE